MPGPRWIPYVLLLLSVACGIWLRVWPSLPAGRTEFLSDGATIARLAIESSATGKFPARDPLAEAPAGRALGPALAPGLIVLAGAFHRSVSALGGHDAAMNFVLLGAIAGGLIAVPVFLWARVQWGAGVAAPFAALLIAFLPAHLQRTFGYSMRYEGAGSLLVTAHLAGLAAALAARSPRRRAGLAIAASLLLVAALWTWRVPIIIPIFEAVLLAAMVALRGAERPVIRLFVIQLAIVSVGMVGIEYLRAQRVLLSAGWLVSCAIVAISFVPRLAPGRARAWERAAWIAAAVAAAALLGGATHGAAAYASSGSLVLVKLRALLGLPVAPDPITRLMLSIEELRSVSAQSLFFGVTNFAAIGPLLLLAPLVFWLAAGRPRWSALVHGPAHAWLLYGTTLMLLALSLFVHRAKVLAGPPAVVVAAGLLPALLASVAKPSHRGRVAGGSGAVALHLNPLVRNLLVALMVTSLAVNAWLSFALAAVRSSRLPEGEREAMRFLRERTPPDAVIASIWELGFEIQSYAHRGTLADGFLESAEGRRRILEMARLGLERSPEPLAAWCRNLGAGYLLVPPRTHLSGIATIADPELIAALRESAWLTREQADRTLVRMMVFGREEPPFVKIFDQDEWRIYALAPRASGGPDPAAPASSTPAPTARPASLRIGSPSIR